LLVSYQWLNIDIGLALRISLPIVDPMNLPSNPWEIAFAATIVAAFASWIPFAAYSLRLFARFGPFGALHRHDPLAFDSTPF
jgi:hypothetical protein